MSKKLPWDNLPEAVAKILEILSSEESEQTAIPEIRQRISSLERKLDDLVKIIAPDRATMDLQTVCRVLKIRPGIARSLAADGTLPSRKEGNKLIFFEDGVVKYHMMQSGWKTAVSKPEPTELTSDSPEPPPAIIATETGKPIDIKAASEILGKSTAAIYQQVQKDNIPFHKEGRKIYFFESELLVWLNTPRTRKRKQFQEQ